MDLRKKKLGVLVII